MVTSIAMQPDLTVSGHVWLPHNDLVGQGLDVEEGEGGTTGEEAEPANLDYGVVRGEDGDGGMRERMTRDGERVVVATGGGGGRATGGWYRAEAAAKVGRRGDER